MQTQTIQQIAEDFSTLAKKLKAEQEKAEQRLKEREAIFTHLVDELFPSLDTALNKGKEALEKTASKLSHKTEFKSFYPAIFSKGIFTRSSLTEQTQFNTKEQK